MDQFNDDLQKYLERWSGVLESISDGLWDWDLITNCVSYSRKWKEMLGFSESEIGNTPEEWKSRIHAGDQELTLGLINNYLKGISNCYESEHRMQCKDGRFKWILSEGRIVARDIQGKPTRIVGTHKDVTHRKNMEFAIKERLKELDCHNRLAGLFSNPDLSVDDVCQKIVEIIPPAWQFPEFTQVSVSVYDKIHTSPDFHKTDNCLSEEIKVNEKVIGRIDVCYSGEAIPLPEPIFLPAESDLLFSVALQIGSYLEINKTGRELRENEERLRVITESALEAIILMDPDGNISYWNPAAERILGYQREEVIGKNLHELLAPERYLDTYRTAFPEFVKTGEGPIIDQVIELKSRHKTGGEIYIELSISKIRIKEGWHAVGFLRDMTKKKEALESLRASELKYRNLVENINDVIYEIDQSGTIKFISSSIEKILEYTAEEIIGKNFVQFVGINSEVLSARLQQLNTSSELRKDYKILSKNGDVRWIRLSTKAIKRDGILEGASGTLIDITETKLVELELQKSESLYRSIINASPDTITITDMAGQIVYSSPQTMKTFGYSHPDEFVNKSIFDFISKDDHARVQLNIGKMMHGVFYGVDEYTGIKCDGSPFAIEVNGEFIRDTEGNPTSMVFITRDISDRKFAEMKLLKSEETYRNLVESINDIVFDVALDGTIKYLSPSIEKLFDYKPEDLIGQNFFIFVHPDDRPFLRDVFRNNRFSEHKNIEYRCLSESGKTIWVQVSAQYSYENGKLVGRTGILHDITEEKLAGEKLRKSEEQYRKLVESVNDVIYEIDATGIIKFVSPSVIRVLGYTVEETLGRNIFDFIYPEDRPNILNTLKSLSDRDYNYLEYRYLRKDGSINWVRSSTSPILENGIMVGGTGILTDVTERKSAELKIISATRLYAVTSQINKAIVHLRDRDKLMKETCRVAIEFGKFQMAWMGLIDEESKIVIPVAFDGVEEGYLSMINPISVSDIPEGRGPTGTAVREGKYYVCEDIENDSRLVLWKEEALRRGYHSSIALPLKQSGKVIGVFTLYSALRHYFNPEEIKLLNEIVDDIGFAFEAIETEKIRKEAEVQLLKLSRAVEQSPVSIVITNLEGDIEYVNPKTCETTGYSMDELLGKNPRVLKSGETPNQDYGYLWDSISHGNVWRGIFHNKRKNNELYWESSQITPILDASGKIMNYLAIKEDITERRITQEALLKSEERFSQIAEQSKTVIWEVDAEGLYTYVSPLAEIIWGYPISEIIGKKYFYDLHPAGTREHFKKIALESFHRKENFSDFHNQIVTGDGRIIWVSTNGIPIVDHQNNLTGYRGADNDITDRIEAEESLKRSENELNYAQEIAQMGSWELNLITKELTSSKNYFNLIEVEPGEIKPSYDYFRSLVHADDLHLLDDNLPKILESKKSSSFEMRLIMPDGRIKWVQISIVPEFDGENLIALKGVNIDITDKKLAEEALIINEAALNQAQEISMMGSWELNLVTNNLTWSKNYYHLMGIPDGKEMKTEFFTEKVHPDDLHLVNEKLVEMYTLKTPVTYDLRLLMPGNEYRWIQNNIVPEFDGDNLVRLKGVNIDVTEKKLAEENIKKQNERLNAIIRAIPDLIFISDRKGTYHEYFNFNAHELLVSENHLIGSTVRDVFDEDTANLHIRKINECIDEQKLVTYEYSAPRNGLVSYYEARLAPLGNERVLRFVRDVTEKKLRDIEIKKLYLAVEQSPVIIIITDLNGNIEYTNPAFEAITGYKFDEVKGENTRILKSGRTNPKVYMNLWETISCGEAWYGEWVNKKKDGNLYWESVSITPIRDDNGIITNYLAVKQDITERKQTETILRQSEENYRYMFVNNPQPMWIYNLETLSFLEVNSAAINHYGYSREEFLSMTLMDIRPKEDIDLLLADVKHSSTILNPSAQWRHLKKNGEIIIVEIVSHLITYNNQDARHVLVSDITRRKKIEQEIRDLNANLELKIEERTKQLATINATLLKEIEERKNIELALSKSEQNYRTVVQNVNEVIFQTNLDGLWIFLNKSWEKLTGFSVEESLGQVFVNFVHPDDREQNWELFEPLISRKKEYCRHEIRYLTKDGGFRWVEVFARLGQNENNEDSGTYGTLMDITERKLAEEALRIKTAELENFFDVTPDLLCITDMNGKFIKMNQAWEVILGYSLDRLENRYFYEFIHTDDIKAADEAMKALNEEHPIINFTNRYKAKDGSYLFIEWHSVPVGGLIYSAARDITERKLAADFENELLQLSPSLTGLPFSKINDAINMALSRIGQFLSADRSYIFEFGNSDELMSNTYEWCNTGVTPEIENLKDILCAALPRWMEMLNRHENIVIPSVNNLPESWQAEREILESQGIKSLIVIPMLAENTLIGFVGLDSVAEKREYKTSEINILKVWSSMLASLIYDQRSEQLLEQTRQNYETFFNTIDDFLFVIDQQGNIIHTNITVNNRLEFTKEELLNQSILSVHPDDRRDEAKRIVGEILAGITEYCPVPVVTKSGRLIPVETRVKPGFWNGNEVIFGVSKDISQIKLSEQKFSTAFHSNSAMMDISDFYSGVHIDINTAFIEILGYSREEVLGKTNKELRIFVDTNLRDEITGMLSQNIPVRKLEIVLRTKDGNLRTGLISCDSIYIGERRCLLSVNMDITERKKAEEEIKKAQLAAEESNRAKSEFLSRMSHELRTPMNSILGFAQLLQMGDLQPRQKKGVDHILHSGKHLLDLINEVLDISRIEAGRISLSLEPLQINSILLEMIDIVQPLARERQLKLEIINLPGNQLFIKADRQRLKQVLMNLLSNAIKYDKMGGFVTIKVDRRPIIESGIVPIRISITDTGGGISTDDIPKLFTPFERIGAEKTQTEGTGLGLAVVKKLMDAMGGTIGVESVPGEGSTFWIELPMAISQLESVQTQGALTGQDLLQTNMIGTILYIEDNVSNIELIEQIISTQRSGIQLISNLNGKQTLPLALQFQPDLILLDLNLPDIQGDEVITLLQADEKTKSIPVVVISANAMPFQLEKLFKAGVKNYLTKPIDIPTFLKEIDKWVVSTRNREIEQ